MLASALSRLSLPVARTWSSAARRAYATRAVSRTPPLVYHEYYSLPWPENHRFPMWKYRELAEHLVNDSNLLTSFGDFVVPPMEASHEELLTCHDSDYYWAFVDDKLPPDLMRRIGLGQRPDHQMLVRHLRLGVAGTILAARLALKHGVAGNLWGGTHHAHRSWGSGYNVWNDVAVAAKVLLEEGVVRRICIVDLDVHQGDGTAELFRDEPRVFTFSMHCGSNFPFGFKGLPHLGHDVSDLDVPLPPGSGDDEFMAALQKHLPMALAQTPDLVLYNSGVDIHADDDLGRLTIADVGIARRDYFVVNECYCERGIPTAFVLGGGYAKKGRAVLPHRHATVCQAIARAWKSSST